MDLSDKNRDKGYLLWRRQWLKRGKYFKDSISKYIYFKTLLKTDFEFYFI